MEVASLYTYLTVIDDKSHTGKEGSEYSDLSIALHRDHQSHNQKVHPRPRKQSERFLWSTHDRFIFVEGRIQDDAECRSLIERLDQLVVQRISSHRNRLQAS